MIGRFIFIRNFNKHCKGDPLNMGQIHAFNFKFKFQ